MSTFSVSRTISIDAPAATVHGLIADLHVWPQWSPWLTADSETALAYSGAERGTGAVMSWSGDRQTGQGSAEIISATARQIDVALTFVKPFAAENRASFSLGTPPENHEGQTQLTWTMTGPQSLLQRAAFRVFGMQARLERDFDKGLLALRRLADDA